MVLEPGTQQLLYSATHVILNLGVTAQGELISREYTLEMCI